MGDLAAAADNASRPDFTFRLVDEHHGHIAVHGDLMLLLNGAMAIITGVTDDTAGKFQQNNGNVPFQNSIAPPLRQRRDLRCGVLITNMRETGLVIGGVSTGYRSPIDGSFVAELGIQRRRAALTPFSRPPAPSDAGTYTGSRWRLIDGDPGHTQHTPLGNRGIRAGARPLPTLEQLALQGDDRLSGLDDAIGMRQHSGRIGTRYCHQPL